MRDAARNLVAASANVSPPAIEEAYVLPQFGDWPSVFTRIDAVYVWTQGSYQVGRDPDDYPLFLAVREQDVDAADLDSQDGNATLQFGTYDDFVDSLTPLRLSSSE